MSYEKSTHYVIALEPQKKFMEALVSMNPIEWRHYTDDKVLKFDDENAALETIKSLLDQGLVEQCSIQQVSSVTKYYQK